MVNEEVDAVVLLVEQNSEPGQTTEPDPATRMTLRQIK
jgi:hypothetical protein